MRSVLRSFQFLLELLLLIALLTAPIVIGGLLIFDKSGMVFDAYFTRHLFVPPIIAP